MLAQVTTYCNVYKNKPKQRTLLAIVNSWTALGVSSNKGGRLLNPVNMTWNIDTTSTNINTSEQYKQNALIMILHPTIIVWNLKTNI